jgi:hypothetical protein
LALLATGYCPNEIRENSTGVIFYVACRYLYLDVTLVSHGSLTTDFGQQPLSAIRINQKWRIRLKGLQKSAVVLHLHHSTGQIYVGILKSQFLRKVKNVTSVISETFFKSCVMCQGLHYKRQLQGTKSPQETCIPFSVCNVIICTAHISLYKIPPTHVIPYFHILFLRD